MVRERTGRLPSHVKAKKMKLLILYIHHAHGCLKRLIRLFIHHLHHHYHHHHRLLLLLFLLLQWLADINIIATCPLTLLLEHST